MSVQRLTGEVSREWAEAAGISWPGAHPDTGEQFVHATEVAIERGDRLHQMLRPRSPDYRVAVGWAHDEDGDEWPVVWRDMTPEECSAADMAYERAYAEWKRTGGLFVERGPETIRGRFETASGSWATGVFSRKSGSWFWTEHACVFLR